MSGSQAYDRAFFDAMDVAASESSKVVVTELMRIFAPTSVVDVGCGRGEWLKTFRDHGVTNVFGLDGFWIDPSELVIDRALFQHIDLERPAPVAGRFDIAISLEVAEHLTPDAADRFVQFLTDLAPVVCFSAAIPWQGGVHHVNEQWPEYWATKFGARGFRCADLLRDSLWADDRVAWWYSQNLLIYIDDKSTRWKNIQCPAGMPLSRIHPVLYASRSHDAMYRDEGFLAVARSLPPLLLRAIRRRLGLFRSLLG